MRRRAPGRGSVTAYRARQDTDDVSVNRHRLLAEGNGGNGGGGIGTDAGKLAQFPFAFGQAAAQVLRHDAGALQQVSRPRIIAEPLPGMQHPVRIGGRQVLDQRPLGQEGQEVGFGRGHRGLLQHDLAQPTPGRGRGFPPAPPAHGRSRRWRSYQSSKRLTLGVSGAAVIKESPVVPT